jgi:small-conductance mechanosensitive channel
VVVSRRVCSAASTPLDNPDAGPAASTYLRVFVAAAAVGGHLGWLAAALSFVGLVLLLEAFPWTAPWGDRLSQAVRQLGGWLVSGVMAAVPGLLTVMLVALVARAVQDALALFMQHVQSGRLRVPFLHADTVGATRRLLNVLVWGLALAVAYPFLPGSDSDAFKGLSVLFGLMITLGSTGVVTQLMSGLVVVYSRSLKKGDFVAVNGEEGVVSEVGALAVKIITMRNEEVTMPNTVITSSPIHNYSKLSGQQGTLVSTRVTIGYDTPWRQVHAMLTNAALATPGVRTRRRPSSTSARCRTSTSSTNCSRTSTGRWSGCPSCRRCMPPSRTSSTPTACRSCRRSTTNSPRRPLVVPRAHWFAAPARPDSGDAR